jgi:hypothetical protein
MLKHGHEQAAQTARESDADEAKKFLPRWLTPEDAQICA